MEKQTQSAYSRGPQIIKLLNENGPLTASAIEKLIEPPMSRRRTNDALLRLVDRGIVVRRFHGLPINAHSQFYQLSARREYQNEIGDILGRAPNLFREPKVRNQELQHSIACAYLAKSLKQNFPNAEVVREFHLLDHRLNREALLQNAKTENPLIPDMILSIPKDEIRHEVNIAIELERSKKSPARLAEKLRRYAKATRIDGVLWMCEDKYIRDSLMRIWSKQERNKFMLISNYFEHFAVFSLEQKIHYPDDSVSNLGGAPIKLNHWINILGITSEWHRNDHAFQSSSLRPANSG